MRHLEDSGQMVSLSALLRDAREAGRPIFQQHRDQQAICPERKVADRHARQQHDRLAQHAAARLIRHKCFHPNIPQVCRPPACASLGRPGANLSTENAWPAAHLSHLAHRHACDCM